jgi:hypothetical protein
MSDDFVDISNTSPNSETLTKEEIENENNENGKNENNENAKNENVENNENAKNTNNENAKNENVDKDDDKSSLENEIFPHKVFNKIFNSSEEIKENDNIISLLLNGFLKNLMKNKASLSDEEEDEDEEDVDEDEDDEDVDDEENDKDDDVEDEDVDEDDVEEDEDEDDYPEIFIIVENKKTFNYDTSYAGASRTMTARFHNFLEQNSTRYLRIDKNEEYITIYERHPNTFAPYEENLIYHIEFFTVEKYKDQ